MATYRLLQVSDKLIGNGEPFWRIEKKVLGLWWTEYFEEHSEWGATFFDRREADTWYEYHANPESRVKTKVLAQSYKPRPRQF